jgi:hypothetical protein
MQVVPVFERFALLGKLDKSKRPRQSVTKKGTVTETCANKVKRDETIKVRKVAPLMWFYQKKHRFYDRVLYLFIILKVAFITPGFSESI